MQTVYNWVDWGPEGFSLWLGSDRGLSVLPISRSIAVSNPNMVRLFIQYHVKEHGILQK